jgi:hypothetical protein
MRQEAASAASSDGGWKSAIFCADPGKPDGAKRLNRLLAGAVMLRMLPVMLRRQLVSVGAPVSGVEPPSFSSLLCSNGS